MRKLDMTVGKSTVKRWRLVIGRLLDRVSARVFFMLGLLCFIASFANQGTLAILSNAKLDHAGDAASNASQIVVLAEDGESLQASTTGEDDEEEFSSDVKLVLDTDHQSEHQSDDQPDDQDVARAATISGAPEIPESLLAEAIPNSPLVVSILSQLGFSEAPLANQVLSDSQTFNVGIGRDAILNDTDARIAPDFHIPEDLSNRVGFWFDVYTKYDSNRRVIHHSRFPWIIFKVVDVSAIINSDTPKHLWMRRMKADKIVKDEVSKIRAALRRLAARRRSSTAQMTELETQVASALAPLGDDLRSQALTAYSAVRIQTGQRDFFADGLRLSQPYLATMEKIFESQRMPMELTRIPFVESSFNKLATSKVGAAGIWQIMDGTGRKFMKIDSVIDERRSPFKATEAAARLLKENHLILYRSWPLAVTAWNHGPGGIRLATQKAGSRDLGKIVARYRSRSFDFASSNFYCEFLAALHAERYSKEIFGSLDSTQSQALIAVRLARSLRFKDVVERSGMQVDEVLKFNSDLAKVARQNLSLPIGFRMHLPEAAVEKLARLVSVEKSRSIRLAKRGD